MIYSAQKSIEDFIVEMLAQKSHTAEELFFSHNASQKEVTIQAIYKSLRKLYSDGVVLKHKEYYSLNNVWKSKIVNLLEKPDTFPVLKEGESIVYSFRSLEQLDEYWKHIQEGNNENVSVTYFFCPHQYWWFVPGRRESEISFHNQFVENKRHAVLLLGGNTKIDRELKSILSSSHLQIHAEDHHGLRMNDNLTIKNNLIVTTRLPNHFEKRINSIFDQNLPFEKTEELLVELFSKKIPVKIIVERNTKKAEKLKKQIGKYFYIKHNNEV